jgi:hypothetical protein
MQVSNFAPTNLNYLVGLRSAEDIEHVISKDKYRAGWSSGKAYICSPEVLDSDHGRNIFYTEEYYLLAYNAV